MKIVDIVKALRNSSAKTMNVVHALQPLSQSIFLAGPTPRSNDVESWRPAALAKLRSLGFTSTVFVPESETWTTHSDYDAQVAWELEALKQASIIVFWVPRNLEDMPGFTTNVEFGFWVQSGKVIMGSPETAPKMKYLNELARRYNIPMFDNLDATLEAAVQACRQIAVSTVTQAI